MALAMAELPLQWAKGATARRKSKQKRAIARKSDGPGNDDSSGSSTDAQEESTIEQLEQRARNKRSSMPVDSKATAQASNSSRKRWEEMSGTEKLWDLWTRERGILWYLNRSAGYSLGFIVVAWILFRFIGPALGLYELQKGLNDFNDLPTSQ